MPLGSRIYTGTVSGTLRRFIGGPFLNTKCRYLGSGSVIPNSETPLPCLQTVDLTFSWRWYNNLPYLYGFGNTKTVHPDGNLEFSISASSKMIFTFPWGLLSYNGQWVVTSGTGAYALCAGSNGTFVGMMGWATQPLPAVVWPLTLGFGHSYTGLLRYATNAIPTG